MKYLFLDTNVYVACCLGDKGQRPQIMQELIAVISENPLVTLLLPEIIRLEFDSVLEKKGEQHDKKFGEIQENIKNGNKNFLYLDDVVKCVESIRKRRKAERAKGKDSVEQLFTLSAVVKVPLSADILVRGYKRQVARQAPFSSEKRKEQSISPICTDCVAFESAIHYIESQGDTSDSVLYVCTDDKDYSSEKDLTKGINFDIKFLTLDNILKEFGREQSQESIAEFNRLIDLARPASIEALSEAMKGVQNIFEPYSVTMKGFQGVFEPYKIALSESVRLFNETNRPTIEALADMIRRTYQPFPITLSEMMARALESRVSELEQADEGQGRKACDLKLDESDAENGTEQ